MQNVVTEKFELANSSSTGSAGDGNLLQPMFFYRSIHVTFYSMAHAPLGLKIQLWWVVPL